MRVSINCATGKAAARRRTGSSVKNSVPSRMASTSPSKRSASR